MADLTYSSLNNWLKFKHLVLLETLARTNNMHLAAEQMNLSQPAVSKMLKEIEGLLGFQVFERLPRNMPVTALGEHVIRYAQRVLNDAKHFVEDIEILRLGGHGFLKVGGIFAATAVVIPNSIIEIKKQWPLLSIDVVEQTSDHLMEMLSEHTLDLAIGRFTDVTQSQFFDFQPLGHFGGTSQRQGNAQFAGASGTAGTVHVIFRDMRQFVVDDIGQVINVETAGGDVGRDQNGDAAFLESFQGFDAVELALVAMNGIGVDAGALQFTCQPGASLFGTDENDALADVAGFEQFDQQTALAVFGHRMHPVGDRLGDGIALGDFDQYRSPEHAVGQTADFFGKRGRKQEALPIGREQIEDAFDVGNEAHVEHSVGFVEH